MEIPVRAASNAELGEAMVQIVADRRAINDAVYISAWRQYMCAEIAYAGCFCNRRAGLSRTSNG